MRKSAGVLCVLLLGLASCGHHDGSAIGGVVSRTPSVFAYMTDWTNSSVMGCHILADGTIGSCATIGGTLTSHPTGMTLNPAKTFAYISNSGSNTVSICEISPVDHSLSNCVFAGGFSYPDGITINAAGTKAYIANVVSNLFTVCDIQLDGAFASCVDAGVPVGNSPGNLIFNSTETRVYISEGDSGGSLIKCDVAIGGTLNSCATLVNPGVSFLSSAIMSLGVSGEFFYAPDSSSSLVLNCAINSADGTIAPCTANGHSGVFPGGMRSMKINNEESRAYLTGQGLGDSPSVCDINSDGSFSNCVALSTGSIGDYWDIALL